MVCMRPPARCGAGGTRGPPDSLTRASVIPKSPASTTSLGVTVSLRMSTRCARGFSPDARRSWARSRSAPKAAAQARGCGVGGSNVTGRPGILGASRLTERCMSSSNRDGPSHRHSTWDAPCGSVRSPYPGTDSSACSSPRASPRTTRAREHSVRTDMASATGSRTRATQTQSTSAPAYVSTNAQSSCIVTPQPWTTPDTSPGCPWKNPSNSVRPAAAGGEPRTGAQASAASAASRPTLARTRQDGRAAVLDCCVEATARSQVSPPPVELCRATLGALVDLLQESFKAAES
mmetsp:Transcript_41336/g.108606  ORF Transcript_41336/g.108606 Transcript_41336/m.108606 type:complete len:291 (+) Transcript_41336:2014-2886(+)